MISFITLSKDPAAADAQLRTNLREVFGPDETFEVIAVDGNDTDIFRGYDEGARRATGDLLAFVHDDIIFECNRRAFDRVLPLFDDPSTGVIGIAGSRTMPASGCWWSAHPQFLRGSAMHEDKLWGFNVHMNCWPSGRAAL